MKLKIRKIEVSPEDFFTEMAYQISIDEKIPFPFYMGTSLNLICKNMGVKPADFWRIKFENEDYFNKLFVVKQTTGGEIFFILWRKITYETLKK